MKMRKLPNGLIDLGGGATPRDPKDKSILLSHKVPPKPISSEKFKELMKKMEYFGKVSNEDFNSIPEMCQFVDFYNNTRKEKKENEFNKEVTARNEYYYKLWIRAIEDSR